MVAKRWSRDPALSQNASTTRRARRGTSVLPENRMIGVPGLMALIEAATVAPFIAALNRVDVVVTDYEMPEMNGATVAASIKAIKPGTPIILFSGSTLVPLRARRVVDAFCDKAGSRDHLLATIHRLLYTKRTRTLQPPPVPRASDHGHRTVA